MDRGELAGWSRDTKLEDRELAPVLAAVRWIVRGGARNSLEHGVLSDELQQLGMPKEHASAIGRVYREKREDLVAALKV